MEILKTKDVAELLSVSLTTIKRWAAMFPDVFPKDRFGHYTFSQKEICLLKFIRDRINHGEALEHINLSLPDDKHSLSLQDPPLVHDNSLEEMLSRINDIERTLAHKADEVVSVQLLRQREELEDVWQTIKQLAVTLETMQKTNGTLLSPQEDLYPVASSKLLVPPRKRGLLRSFFSFL